MTVGKAIFARAFYLDITKPILKKFILKDEHHFNNDNF